ncbi:MAG TPA: hypothetical protein VE133_00975, partial [Candidatus Sulfotelmatobacter sp.]|nr:hypothetical protein [Candidatus Sulfotelmatobacter sp.]
RAGEGEVQGPAVAKLVPAQSAELKSDAAPRLVVTKAPENGEGSKVSMWNASLKVDNGVQKRPHRNKRAVRKLSNFSAANAAPSEPVLPAGLQPSQAAPEYVTVRQEFVMVVAQQGDAGTQSWQMHVVQISVTQSKPQKQLPKKI